MTPAHLHERIAEALGWTEAEAKTFSLSALREVVRPVNSKLAYEISQVIQSEEHIVGEPLRPKRRVIRY